MISVETKKIASVYLENPIEDRLFTPLFPPATARFISDTRANSNTMTKRHVYHHTAHSAVRALTRVPVITRKADSMPASTHFAHGTPPNLETNTCCLLPRVRDIHTMPSLCQRQVSEHTTVFVVTGLSVNFN